MSPSTWTPPAVASEAAPRRLKLWRAVESQHAASTTRLVDSLAGQAVLEQVLEAAKPPLPAAARHLHYLLATPFRYPPPPRGSRCRSASDAGVFYGADLARTACAELGYWRWRFLTDSPALARLDSVPHTLFSSEVEGPAVDLRHPPFVADSAAWTHPADYSATQAFGRVAREAGIALLRYQSVRDPQAGGCCAVLWPTAFRRRSPTATQAWFLTVTREAAIWLNGRESFEFFAAGWRWAA